MFDPGLARSAPPSAAERPAGDRRMKVSPLDLRQVRFRSTFRGFDRAEVTALMVEVAEDYEHALREGDILRQQGSKMEALVNQHRENERALRNTLVTPRRLSDDLHAKADATAKPTIPDAEGP